MIRILYKLFYYYLLIFLGLFISSWIIWTRFLRQRVVRNIPDNFFTEYRFWILLYICFIYLYVVKSLVKPKEPHVIIAQFLEILFTPLTTLDRFIKYNFFIKPYYDKFCYFFTNYLHSLNNKQLLLIIYSFDVIPRFLLASLLLIDCFWFNQIELFYKLVLIGLLPFIFRYLNYSAKMITDNFIEILEDKYDEVIIFEKGYEGLMSRREETEAIHHFTTVSLKEYIKIKYKNIWDNVEKEDFPYEYVGDVYPKGDIIREYAKTHYGRIDAKLSSQDYDALRALYEDLMPRILRCKLFLNHFDNLKQSKKVTRMKIIIFTSYFICWSFVLIVSYYNYPVEFHMLKKLIIDFLYYYMVTNNDPFVGTHNIVVENSKQFCEKTMEKFLP